MARLLTKHRRDGSPYARPRSIEEAIDGALKEDIPGLAKRLKLEKGQTGYLPSECLVHLLRLGVGARNLDQIDAVLVVLTKRCEANLQAGMGDDRFPNAAEMQQEALDEFLMLFFEPEQEAKLDFFEIRFNQAFRALRIGVIRRHAPRPLMRSLTGVNGDAEASQSTSDDKPPDRALSVPAIQLDACNRSEILAAAEKLEPEVREALWLQHLGYEVESKDPGKRTIARIQAVSGRTVWKRIAQAVETLSPYFQDA
jgi:hypothetical protein